jgi:uncharacterized protein
VEIASLVPAEQGPKLELLAELQHLLRRLPARGAAIPHALPDVAAVRAEVAVLVKNGPAAPEVRGALELLGRRLDALPAATAARRLRGFEERLAADLAEDLHRLRDVARPAPITLADLPAALRERHVSPNGQWLLRVFGKGCLWDYQPLADFCDQVHAVDRDATGKPIATLEGLRSMREGFHRAGLYALLAIVAVLLLDFRRPRHVLLALAPLAVGVVMTLGILGMWGWPLNPANMIAFPLILGVGVDNGVHVLHDYLARKGERKGYRLSHTTGQGILVAALTTILGFGTLMTSGHRGLVSLGLILTLGVGCCMLAALVLLPAALRLVSLHRHAGRAADGEGVARRAA